MPTEDAPRGSTRRSLLKATVVGAAAVALPSAGVLLASPASAATHPGMLHTETDFARMRTQVNAGAQPWKAGWDKLVANSHSQSTWTPRPTATVIRGGTGENYTAFYNDIAAAYQNALRWRISGSTANGNKARDILNAWSGTLTTITGNADRFLAAGIYGYEFANAAEIMRGYSGFDIERFKRMMLNIFYPMNDDFLTNHNDACITNYWANWDLCNMASMLAIGVLCDDQAKIDRAVNYFRTGAGNGSILHAIPFLHSGGLAQWQEMGRDQGHTMMGVGLMGTFCEMAWNQGIDLYGYSDNRFMQACEYIARYNLGQTVPFTTYQWGTGQNCAQVQQTAPSSASRGQNRPVWALVHAHFVGRRGQSLPNITAYMNRVRPEGGGGDYGSTSGGFDHLGFGTLLHTGEAAAPTPIVSGGIYKLICERSGKALDNFNVTTDGRQAVQWTDNGGTPQQWRITDVGSGYYKLVNIMSGKALDNGNLTTDGAAVAQWPDNGGTPQRWQITDVGGAYKLICERSGKALDNFNVTTEGAGVIQWADISGPQQRWHLTRIS
jgi:hypothetical protein